MRAALSKLSVLKISYISDINSSAIQIIFTLVSLLEVFAVTNSICVVHLVLITPVNVQRVSSDLAIDLLMINSHINFTYYDCFLI